MGLLAQAFEMRWLFASIALLIFAVDKYRRYRRLKAFKGPFSTGFSEIWHSLTILSMKSHLAYRDVCNKYGQYYSGVERASILIRNLRPYRPCWAERPYHFIARSSLSYERCPLSVYTVCVVQSCDPHSTRERSCVQ